MSEAASSNSEDPPSSGFERFWKKSTSPSPVRFIQEEPSSSASKKERTGLARFLPARSSSTPNHVTQDTDKSDRRRQQVYSAQKRHRNRKNEYIKSLEREIATLRNLDSSTNTERHNLEHDNQVMKAKLQNHLNGPIDSDGDAMMGLSSVFVQHDPVMDHERLYVEQRSQASSANGSANSSPGDDSWLALDFILALEWPCRHHVRHVITVAPGENPKPCGGTGGFHGHGMTTMSAVLTSLQSPDAASATSGLPTQVGIEADILKKWKLPHAEIDKLVRLAEAMKLDDELLTPAQAYAATKAKVSNPSMLKTILDRLKVSLAAISDCEGFGAIIPTVLFYQHLDAAMAA